MESRIPQKPLYFVSPLGGNAGKNSEKSFSSQSLDQRKRDSFPQVGKNQKTEPESNKERLQALKLKPPPIESIEGISIENYSEKLKEMAKILSGLMCKPNEISNFADKNYIKKLHKSFQQIFGKEGIKQLDLVAYQPNQREIVFSALEKAFGSKLFKNEIIQVLNFLDEDQNAYEKIMQYQDESTRIRLFTRYYRPEKDRIVLTPNQQLLAAALYLGSSIVPIFAESSKYDNSYQTTTNTGQTRYFDPSKEHLGGHPPNSNSEITGFPYPHDHFGIKVPLAGKKEAISFSQHVQYK